MLGDISACFSPVAGFSPRHPILTLFTLRSARKAIHPCYLALTQLNSKLLETCRIFFGASIEAKDDTDDLDAAHFQVAPPVGNLTKS